VRYVAHPVADVAGEYTTSRVVTLSMKSSSDGMPSFPCCPLLFNAEREWSKQGGLRAGVTERRWDRALAMRINIWLASRRVLRQVRPTFPAWCSYHRPHVHTSVCSSEVHLRRLKNCDRSGSESGDMRSAYECHELIVTSSIEAH
jgi:hypothetical protein